MGTRSSRITREDFLTPPEFEGFASNDHPAGRVGGARLELVRSGDRTRLGTCFQQIPIQLLPPFSFDRETAALLYLINPTAGLMDGDGHHLQITARAGTHAVIAGQSATRIHPAVLGYATQQWSVSVEDDACLIVLPGPTIPFRGSRYYQRGRVELAPRARFLWGDVWLPGRYDRGVLSERFEFERIVQDFETRRAGKLVYRDRFRWDGPWSAEDAEWYLGGALASASLFVAGPLPDVLPAGVPNLRRSVFRLDTGESCIRWCGAPGEVTADLVGTALRLAASWTTGAGSRPWLVESRSLAPNHWFSPAAP